MTKIIYFKIFQKQIKTCGMLTQKNFSLEDTNRLSGYSERKVFFKKKFCIVFLFCLSVFFVNAQTDSIQDASKLSEFSLEELMNVKVTSVSMRPEKLTEVASAIQVITGEDIHRSGTTRLPEALQLASNLQMAHVNSHDWAITARGFNGLPSSGGILANKLLVMIDGRSVYNPLFGGVYWDVQNTMIKDIDRIEVVSGPGGTLWGANAVNGVINIVTKSAKETQGLYASGAKGTFLNGLGELRFGGRSRIDSNLYFRIYAQHYDQKSTERITGNSARDAWNMTQGGFRMDYYPSAENTFTLQGDAYGGEENKDSLIKHNVMDGQNIMARFTHTFSEKSDLKIQAYYDRTWRTTPHSKASFFYSLKTYDLDIQHRFSIGNRHSVLYGAAYRLQEDRVARGLKPLSRDMPLYSAFIQDEISIAPERLKLTIGSKFLSNVFTGFEYQPCARLGWILNKNNTVWTSVSRAIRIPTRFDADVIVTDVKFKSEKVVAYELGYRTIALERISLSFATFYNHYHDIRSLDSTSNPKTPIILANNQVADSWGFEFNGNYQVTEMWRLRGGYTYFNRNIKAISNKVLPVSVEFESVDPKNIVMIQSVLNVTRDMSFDIVGRYVDVLPAASVSPKVPSYVTFDARFAWQFKQFEFSIVGQNLLEKEHIEVGTSKIPRSVYARITCQF